MVWPCKRGNIFKLHFSYSLFSFYCDFIMITEKEKVISFTSQGHFILDDWHDKLNSFVLVTKYLICDSTLLCHIEQGKKSRFILNFLLNIYPCCKDNIRPEMLSGSNCYCHHHFYCFSDIYLWNLGFKESISKRADDLLCKV